MMMPMEYQSSAQSYFYQKDIIGNVNPGLINPGWLIVVVAPNSDKWLLKWYPPQLNSLGVY